MTVSDDIVFHFLEIQEWLTHRKDEMYKYIVFLFSFIRQRLAYREYKHSFPFRNISQVFVYSIKTNNNFNKLERKKKLSKLWEKEKTLVTCIDGKGENAGYQH